MLRTYHSIQNYNKLEIERLEREAATIESLFGNHLILKKIAKYIPLKGLKRMRRVNKLWFLSFSKRIFLKINNSDDYLTFLLFHQYKTDAEDSLGMPYKNFNFENWSKIEHIDPQSILVFKHLSEITNIRQLILPKSYYSFENLRKILDLLSSSGSSLEYLSIGLSFYDLNRRNRYSTPKIKHLHLHGPITIQNASIVANKIRDFFCFFNNSSLTEITIQDSFSISEFLDALIDYKPSNLKKLNILNGNLYPSVKDQVEKLIHFSKEFQTQNQAVEINYFGNKFSSTETADFFQVYALFEEKLFNTNFKENNKEFYKRLQLESVKAFNSKFLYRFSSIPFEKCLFHFPNVQQISISDISDIELNGEEQNEPIHDQKHLFEELNQIDLKTCKFHLYSDTIRSFKCFPNLTKLDIKLFPSYINPNFKIELIFQNLTKLKDLAIIGRHLKVDDTNLTGIPKEYIEYRLLDETFKYLLDFKSPRRIHQGITTLKDLEKFSLVAGQTPTEMSLFFGFCQLLKLKHLMIHHTDDDNNLNFMTGISWKSEYWDIFHTKFRRFRRLETIKIYSGVGNSNSYRQERIQDPVYNNMISYRPHLSIQFLWHHPSEPVDAEWD